MRRRQFLAASQSIVATAIAQFSVGATAAEADQPFMPTSKIVDGLTAKDIVLDQPGRVRPALRQPAVNLYVQFDFDSANLRPEGRRQLDELAAAMNAAALVDAQFLIAGHTDRAGSFEYNKVLSQSRAEVARNYLVEVCGIDTGRLKTHGYGYSQLLDIEHPGAAINRRVEVRRLAALGSQPPASDIGGGRFIRTPH